MVQRRQIVVAVVAVVVSLGGRPFVPETHVAAETIPSRLSDRAFWQLVTELSETGGYFRSDNFLSNENAFQSVIPELKSTLPTGGVYLGVGPEQNFTYIVALRPKLAFVIDIRRQNMIEQLLYKAFIEASSNRADFLSRLFARKRPSELSNDATVEALFAAYADVMPSEALFRSNLQAARDRLVNDHKFALSPDDLKSLEYVYSAFFRGGPELNYSFSPSGVGGFGGGFPSYRELMVETDGQGEKRSYLATEENFRLLREYEKNNMIVPVVGDFGGDKALRAVGDYVRAHEATVTVFYTSNVEQYLFQEANAWRKFLANVATFPIDGRSTFIRFDLEPGLHLQPVSQVFARRPRLDRAFLNPRSRPGVQLGSNPRIHRRRQDVEVNSRREMPNAERQCRMHNAKSTVHCALIILHFEDLPAEPVPGSPAPARCWG